MRLPARIGSVCLQELKQTYNGRVIRAGAGGRMGAQARAYSWAAAGARALRRSE